MGQGLMRQEGKKGLTGLGIGSERCWRRAGTDWGRLKPGGRSGNRGGG